MRQLPIGSILFPLRFSAARAHTKISVPSHAEGWFPALLLAALALIACVHAQAPGTEPDQTTTGPAPKPGSAASVTPLPRFVPRDNLLFVGTLVLRGGSTQENKAFSSRLLGLLMGSGSKPRTERQSGRVLVHVPRGPSPEAGWAWWPKKDDLVIGFMQPCNVTSIFDAVDGETPSAGSQENWMRLKVDPTHLPKVEDLTVFMFPGTLAVVADEQSIRLVTRESFPNLYGSAAVSAIALSLTLPAIQAACARTRGGPDVGPGGMAPGQFGPDLAAVRQGNFPGAVPRTEGATTPATDGASAPGLLSPSRLGRPAPGNRGPG